MKNTNQSLKFKLILLCVGITFFLGATSVGVLQYIIHTQEKTELGSFTAYANNASDAVAAQFFERYGDVQAFAINPSIQSNDRNVIIDTLNAYSALYGIYDLIMVVDLKGHLVAVNSKDPTGKPINVKSLYELKYSDTPWFKAVINGQTSDSKEKGFSGTFAETIQVDPYVTEVFGEKRLGSSFSSAIRDSKGQMIGIVTNRAGSRWFEVAFKELVAGMKDSGFKNVQTKMIDADGTLLFEYTSPGDKLVDSTFDWNRLTKINLAADGSAAAGQLKARKSDAVFETNSLTQKMDIVGFAPVDGPKFVDQIGWGIMVSDSKDEAMASLNHAQKIFFVIFSLVAGLACICSYWFASVLSKRLMALANQLSAGSKEVAAASASISGSSTELSEAATEQAASIQETAASIDEVSAMVKKSAESADHSRKASESSRVAAEQGQESVQEMIRAIRGISESNTTIMTQVSAGNQKISEIVRVISEIENKTKVINDIVFQTKLLSFNASVEAARAGEHGKGFAVVAEEVGNLATMSGNAAKEISSMLESSIQKVESIVNETKTSVEKLVVESKTRVESGMKVADRCGEALTQILTTVQEVDGMVSEISTASQEQSIGVSEINKAINQLDQVTHQNTSVAQGTADSAQKLDHQSRELQSMVSDLYVLIHGKSPAQEESFAPTQHTKSASVIPFPKPMKAPSHSPTAVPKKLAAGAEGQSVPSKDDPRFEDV